ARRPDGPADRPVCPLFLSRRLGASGDASGPSSPKRHVLGGLGQPLSAYFPASRGAHGASVSMRRVSLLWAVVFLFAIFPFRGRAAEEGEPAAGDVVRSFRARQAAELRAAQEEKARLQAQLAKLRELQSSLSLPDDKKADEKLAQ